MSWPTGYQVEVLMVGGQVVKAGHAHVNQAGVIALFAPPVTVLNEAGEIVNQISQTRPWLVLNEQAWVAYRLIPEAEKS